MEKWNERRRKKVKSPYLYLKSIKSDKIADAGCGGSPNDLESTGVVRPMVTTDVDRYGDGSAGAGKDSSTMTSN